MVKNTGCSCRGLVLDSQHPQGDSQLSETLVLEDPTFAFWSQPAPGIHVAHRHTCRETPIYMKQNNKQRYFYALAIIFRHTPHACLNVVEQPSDVGELREGSNQFFSQPLL